MDPRTYDGAAFADVTQGGGDERAHRSEDDHRVELVGRAGERVPRPGGAERARELLCLVVTCARACVDLASLRDRDLADDVGGRAEAVQPDALGVAGEPQRAVPDQPRAEERRGLLVRVALGDREAEALVGDDVLCVSPVAVVAGEARAVAEVLGSRPAEAALTAGPAEPGHAHARSGLEPHASRDHLADDLMTGYERELRVRELTVDDVEIGSAHPARVHCEQDLALTGRGLG